MSSSSTKRRTRKDPRKESTQAAIIESAESLFAQFGIESVSLRQIGASIGSSNTSVVAYHFGDKKSLIEAIFHYRLPLIEARREELLEELVRNGAANEPFSLLRALWLPLWEQVNEKGVHSFAGFLSALTFSDMGGIRVDMTTRFPVSSDLARRLKRELPESLRPLFDARLMAITVMITGVLKIIDQSASQKSSLSLFKDTLQMATAALLAPVGDN